MMNQPITPKPMISAPPMMNSTLRPVSPVVRARLACDRGRRGRLRGRQRPEGAALSAGRSGDGEDEQGREKGNSTRHGLAQGSQAGAPVNAQREEAKRAAHVNRRTPMSATSPHHTPTMPQSSVSESTAIGM